MAVVLLVDDDPDILQLVQMIVEEYGHQTLTAANGKVALTLARDHMPALVITDLMMPVLDGYGLIAALRADPVLQALPIVVMSAGVVALEQVRERVLVQRVIHKPFLIATIEDVLNEFTESS